MSPLIPNISAPVASPAQATPNVPPIPLPVPPTKYPGEKEKFLPFILAFFAIVTGIILFLLLRQLMTKPTSPPPVTVIVTPTPTPTPVRIPTQTSTTSAFMEFSQTVSSFSGTLQNFEKSDPSLSPPSLVLPLGFSN